MTSQDILFSKGQNDECYTPRYAVEEIVGYIPKDKIVWCPFDRDDSEFTKVLKEKGYKVINSHIDYGQDFYEFEPKEWDIIVSNPPFTNKRKIFERALSFNKPFALLMSNTWLNDSAPKVLFGSGKDLELLMFRNRIKFMNNGVVNNKITFSSSFFCWNFLPKQIVISNL